MLYAAIDIDKRLFRAAVLDVESGETVERRFGATREELDEWVLPFARRAVRAAGLDPVVDESGEARRRGRLAKQGAPVLGWALVEAAQHAQRA